jgi:hypothetical protein
LLLGALSGQYDGGSAQGTHVASIAPSRTPNFSYAQRGYRGPRIIYVPKDDANAASSPSEPPPAAKTPPRGSFPLDGPAPDVSPK